MSFLNFRITRIVSVVTVLLLAVQMFVGLGCRDSKGSFGRAQESIPQIESAIAKLLTRHQVDEKSIKTRKVPSSDGKFTRLERRISVAPEFNTLNFNHDLNQAVAEFGATAIATEKSEDKSVTMHIKKDGVIVQSLVFVVK
mgnify:CR=1 FL=1